MKITYRKISKQEEIKHFKNIKVNGFTVIKNLIPKTTIKKYLDLTKETYKKQKKNSKTPKVWNTAKIIYNLQSKSNQFLKVLNSNFTEKNLNKKYK